MKESLLKDHAESSRLVGESDGEYRPRVWLQLGPMRVTAPCFGRGLVIGTVVVCLIALPICIWELKEKQHAEDHIVAWFVGGVFALLVRARWMLVAGACFQGLTPRVVRIVCVCMCVYVVVVVLLLLHLGGGCGCSGVPHLHDRHLQPSHALRRASAATLHDSDHVDGTYLRGGVVALLAVQG